MQFKMSSLHRLLHRTRRAFKIRHNEHINAICYNYENPVYSQHILNGAHLCGTVENTLRITNIKHKKPYMNSLVWHRMYKLMKQIYY